MAKCNRVEDVLAIIRMVAWLWTDKKTFLPRSILGPLMRLDGAAERD
ncbi:UNVERIFIED_CONTAM: hypothetical protein ABID98_003776 [Brevibacillus sp. OAP136]